jgi:hypothetical protein
MNFKILTLHMFLLMGIVFTSYAKANQPDPQELEGKISELYSSINPEGLSQDVFRVAYLKYIEFSSQGKLGNKSLITVVDFNKPSSQDRMWIMDVGQNARLIKKSLVTHGVNSGYLMAEQFSNQHETRKSSLKFYITGNPYQSSKVGYALKLHGQDPGINSNIFPRGIVLHRAVYATYERAARGAIGRSWGCLGVPVQHNRMFVDLLQGKTLIYVHSDQNPGSSPAITSDMVTRAQQVESTNSSPQVPPTGEPPMTYDNNPAFSEVRNQQTMGAQNGTNSVPLLGEDGDPAALGVADDQREVAPASENDAPDKIGMADLHGTAGFEACQNLASEPWCSIVKKVKGGADPHQFFEASWNDVQSKMENSDNIEDWRAENMAKNNLGMIRECAALVHLTDKTDCEKDNKNEDEETASKDKAIECQYKGAESQDYKHCVKTVQGYDAIEEKTAVRYQEQKVEFNSLGTATADKLSGGDNKQVDASGAQQQLIAGAAGIANERGELAAAKAQYLQSALTKFPTRQSRLDHCKKEYSRHSDGGIKLYKEFVKMYSTSGNVTVPKLPDPCYNAMVRMGPKLIHNVKARNQIKKVVQKAGLVAQDYYDKEARLMANKGAAKNIQSQQQVDDVDLIDSSKFGFNCNDDEDCKKRAKTKFDKAWGGSSASGDIGGKGGQSYAAFKQKLMAAKRERERRSFAKLKTDVHDEELYVTMDRAIVMPTKKNLKKVEPEVVEFGRYYDFKDRQGQVAPVAKKKIEPFLAMNGVETRSMRKRYSNKISGERQVWRKKDGTLFEFDIHKKKDNSLWDIISNRYRRVYNPEGHKID